MDFPPTIPTSFVPRPASATPQKFRSNFTGAFGFIAYSVLGTVFVLALVVFFYNQILINRQSAKDAELTKAEQNIDLASVDSFIRLRDRLTYGKDLLSSHVAFSGFFSSLEKIMPATIRFSSLHLSVGDNGKVIFEGSGTAKNFNALAAASTAFAHDGRIKDAIFSNIVVKAKDNSVSFKLTATIDPKMITFSL
ncbi:MAG: hypothetical protein NTU85_00655 [Candidatus Kaiserbacteria bacterium]|nr:hypothetical protein [Candidatus Kaiserbacteria bacterium]